MNKYVLDNTVSAKRLEYTGYEGPLDAFLTLLIFCLTYQLVLPTSEIWPNAV